MSPRMPARAHDVIGKRTNHQFSTRPWSAPHMLYILLLIIYQISSDYGDYDVDDDYDDVIMMMMVWCDNDDDGGGVENSGIGGENDDAGEGEM